VALWLGARDVDLDGQVLGVGHPEVGPGVEGVPVVAPLGYDGHHLFVG